MLSFLRKIKGDFFTFLKRGAGYVFFGQFFSKFVAFFGSIAVVRLLSKQDYGILGYFENIYGYIFIFAGFGLGNAIIRFVVLEQEPQKKKAIFRFAVVSAFVVDIVFAALLALGSIAIPFQSEYDRHAYLLAIMAFTLPFQDAFLNCCLHERAMFDNKRYAVASSSVSVLVIMGKVVGAFLAGINGVVISQLIIYGVASVLLVRREKRKYYSNDLPSYCLDRRAKKEMVTYSAQYMVTNGLWAVFMLNDIFLLGVFGATPDTLANYKVAYVLPGNLAIISTAIGIVVAPYFIQHENDVIWVRSRFQKVFLGSVAAIGGSCCVLAVFAEPLIVLLYGQDYSQVANLMRAMLVMSFFNCGIRYTIANLLSAMGEVKYNMLIAFLGITIQIIAAIFLIPRYGTIGVVCSNIIAHLLMSTMLGVSFYRSFYMRKHTDS